jgi:broad specificity phosphatase PhoE
LISHAATAAQRRGAFPLDENVERERLAEVAGLGWIAPRAQQLFVGPELRTLQTAEALGLSGVLTQDLRDCNYGRWSGLELSEVQEREPEKVIAWLTDTTATVHGGESIVELMGRVAAWMEGLRGSGHTIAVTHPAVIRAAIVSALDSPLQAFWRIDIAPLSLTDLRFNGRVWTLRCTSCELRRGYLEDKNASAL